MAARTMVAAALLAAAQPVAAQAAAFPCDTIRHEGLRIFEGIAAPSEARSPAAVKLKRNALLGRESFPLVTRWLTLDDAALATDAGSHAPVPFRAYRIGGERRFCTQIAREHLFGARDRDGNYLLRCLYDADGDGRFESFRAHAELVPYDSRTGEAGPSSGKVPPLHPLPRPITLVESADAKDPSAAFAPRIDVETRVATLTGSEVVVKRQAQVATLPGASGRRFRGSEDVLTATLRLAEGGADLGGRPLVLSRKGRDWHAALAPANTAPAELQCEGSVVAIGGTFWIMSDAGMMVIAAGDLPRG